MPYISDIIAKAIADDFTPCPICGQDKVKNKGILGFTLYLECKGCKATFNLNIKAEWDSAKEQENAVRTHHR